MTKKEKINRNIGLTFDFLRQVVDDSVILQKLPDGSTLEFIEKDFPTTQSRRKTKTKYLKVKSQILL